MLEGRSDGRVARLAGPLEGSFAGRLDVPTVDFRYLDLRFNRFELTVSPPHPHSTLSAGAAASRFERSAVFPNPPDAATTTQKGLLRWCRR
jgi:hypothetical protein